MLARQVHCHLNHTCSLFTLVIIWIGSRVFFQVNMDYDPPYLHFHIAG
jgi:hypothetical protein